MRSRTQMSRSVPMVAMPVEDALDNKVELVAEALDRADECNTCAGARAPLEGLLRDLDVLIALLTLPKDD
jgi:hypothetical protein